jgi:hypothetical protein
MVVKRKIPSVTVVALRCSYLPSKEYNSLQKGFREGEALRQDISTRRRRKTMREAVRRYGTPLPPNTSNARPKDS